MEIIIIVLLILCNGVLSMSEIALVSARKVKLENSAKKGSKAALSALKLSQDPDYYIFIITFNQSNFTNMFKATYCWCNHIIFLLYLILILYNKHRLIYDTDNYVHLHI